jgi:hypothetical protein
MGIQISLGFFAGLLIGFAVGVYPKTRGFVYSWWDRGKAYAKRRGWIK